MKSVATALAAVPQLLRDLPSVILRMKRQVSQDLMWRVAVRIAGEVAIVDSGLERVVSQRRYIGFKSRFQLAEPLPTFCNRGLAPDLGRTRVFAP